jgi:hypothetical protein
MTHLDSNGNWKPVAIVRSAINTDNRPPLVWSTDASVASTWSSTLSTVRRDLLQAVGGFYRSTPPVGGGLRITRRDIAHDPPPEVPPQVATPSSLQTPDV